jgi:NADH-quinone oxidoreductase subunit J
MEALNNLLGGTVVPDALFYVFAALTLLCAILVVANPFSRNPVTNAMFLVLTIISMAGLFLLLHAFFLAAVQILVYAGAVIVLFLFVIMLLDLKEEQRRRIKLFGVVAGFVSVGLITLVFLKCLHKTDLSAADSPVIEGDTAALGRLLFTQYVLPFEMVSILLLVAMIGVIVLSKKDEKAVPPGELGLPEIKAGNDARRGAEKSKLNPASSSNAGGKK